MTPVEADLLARAFSRDGAPSVIDSMLGARAATQDEAEDRVAGVMRSLEEMAEHRVDAACCLMLSLWPVAGELMMHDVCDRIFLWIDDKRSAGMIAHLKHLVASEVDSDVKRSFEGLLFHIEQKA